MEFLENYCTFCLLDSSQKFDFDCGDDDLNEFFGKDFLYYSNQLLGKTYCFTLNQNPNVIICAFTIANDSIKTCLLPKRDKNRISRKINNEKRSLKSYPAVIIGRLGVNIKYQRQNIGIELMDFIKGWFIDKENKTGCRFIVVDSYNTNKAINFYKENDFKFLFNDEMSEKQYTGIETEEQLKTRLMYYDLIVLK